jgi:hypothetical protein
MRWLPYYKSLGIACSAHDEIVVGRVRSDGAGGGLAIFNAHSGETLRVIEPDVVFDSAAICNGAIYAH